MSAKFGRSEFTGNCALESRNKTDRRDSGFIPNRTDLEEKAYNGRASDVDYMMSFLFREQSFGVCKLIDFVLSLVVSYDGKKRIKHYLFYGNKCQRNYAALYFKRLGKMRILKKAVSSGCIDEVQAFSK